MIAETASAAKQAEAQRDLELKKADYTASVRKQQATADKTYDIQANIMQQQVMAEQVRIERSSAKSRSRCRTPKSSAASAS